MYTYKQLQKISATRQGVNKKIYYCDNKTTYQGKPDGTLAIIIESNDVVVNNTNKTITQALETNSEGINNIDLQLQSESIDGYTVLSYDSGGNIVKKIVYLDSSLQVSVFVVNYSYSGDDLIEIEVKRVSDGFTYKKVLTYDNTGNLINKNTINV